MNILSVLWNVDPAVFSIGSFRVLYSQLSFVLAFGCGFFLFRYFFKREGLPEKLLESLLFTMIIATIAGARLGHCLFYQPRYYLAHPLEILQLWKGGLSSHGGAVAIIISLWFWVRHYGKAYGFDYWWLVDRMGIAVALAGFFIRIGNLMNSEVYGMETSLPWGFLFVRKGETVPMHPTQLYEALAYLAIFIFLFYLYKKQIQHLKRGALFGAFLMLFFSARFLIEYVKQPQVDFEQGMMLNMGQLLSVPFILCGAVLFLCVTMRGKPALLVDADAP